MRFAYCTFDNCTLHTRHCKHWAHRNFLCCVAQCDVLNSILLAENVLSRGHVTVPLCLLCLLCPSLNTNMWVCLSPLNSNTVNNLLNVRQWHKMTFWINRHETKFSAKHRHKKTSEMVFNFVAKHRCAAQKCEENIHSLSRKACINHYSLLWSGTKSLWNQSSHFYLNQNKVSIIPAVSTIFILKGDLVAFQQNIATFFVYVYYLDHFSSGRCSAISTGTICHFQCFLCRLFPAGPCLSTYAIIARI